MKVLLIEDDEKVADSFARSLRLLGHEIATATTAAGGREILRAKAVDVVVADHGLPAGETGTSLLAWARNAYPAVQRILVSGVGRPDNFTDEPPQQVFLPKPFNLRELMAVVQVASAPSK